MTGPGVQSDIDPDATKVLKGKLTRAVATATGALRRLETDEQSILMYPAEELEDGPGRVRLRIRHENAVNLISLYGQSSPLRGLKGEPLTRLGRVGDLEIRLILKSSASDAAWFVHVRVVNHGVAPVTVDLVLTQDVSLAPLSVARINEYYVSQYLDLTPLEVPDHGSALAVRQNMPGAAAPWLLIGCLGQAVGWATDARQLTGTGREEGAEWPGLYEDLPSARLQGEHSLAALQTAATTIAPGAQIDDGFYGYHVADHPDATSPADAAYAERALADPAATPPDAANSGEPDIRDHRSLFGIAQPFGCRDLTETEVTGLADGKRQVEVDGGQLWSYFTGTDAQLVTRAKQARVLRPHGQLLRSGTALLPEENSVCTTVWMDGSFCSHLTQEHVGAGTIVSPRRSYLGLQRAHGLRIFVRDPGGNEQDWRLLGTPSAWLIGLDHARWWYADGQRTIRISTEVPAPVDAVTVTVDVLAGPPIEVLVAAHLTWRDADQPAGPVVPRPGGVRALPPPGAPAQALYEDPGLEVEWTGGEPVVGDDSALFVDGASRGLPWLTLRTVVASSWTLTLTPDLVPPARQRGTGDFWTTVARSVRLAPPDSVAGAQLTALGAVLPWFGHDAVIHYLSPRGLEQFSGGAWGTRDVSQGPVGLLLAVGAHAEFRELMIMIMSAQNDAGDWPQAFDFLTRHRQPGQGGAHGDVVYWPLLALGEYLQTTGDTSLLDQAEITGRVAKALDHIESTMIGGTRLPAYGHGDWNDSLQPVDHDLAARLCSTWTVVLQAHSLGTLGRALATAEPELGRRARLIADGGIEDLRRLLLVDGVLPGYGLFDENGTAEPLIHPRDSRTGLHYSVLPMIHAISGDLLTPTQARRHLDLIEEQLLGVDGVRLFDRPVSYTGGPMTLFQRAEASTFFGREIGLMYMHAHLRYAEALARVGDGRAFLRALGQAHPVGLNERVPSARPRQSTCYYSSSDAAFADRFAARDHYVDAVAGRVPLEGGWRVYSSGPGLFLRIVVENLLGIRVRGEYVELDPVLDPDLDGLEAEVPVGNRSIRVRFHTGEHGHGVRSVRVGGVALAHETLSNPYRIPGVRVRRNELTGGSAATIVEIETS